MPQVITFPFTHDDQVTAMETILDLITFQLTLGNGLVGYTANKDDETVTLTFGPV